ncbi:glycoside hydrolase family 95-like protein [Salipaludibacillus sp. CF4.18]|uniref:glycoside hydrolase family 95-like protein n=1 Tax=Salipaludibacillus sp. CF4.18 TaxID=3373081 RepID=UPI003EE51369
MQSHAGEIHLLPGLPKKWSSGTVKGLRTKGAFEVDMEWSNHTLLRGKVRSLKGNKCTLRVKGSIKIIDEKGEVKVDKLENNVYQFQTKIGKDYMILHE